MSQDIEKQINQLNQKLQSVFKEQDRNQSAIQTQEHVEADFHEWRNRSNRLFNRILETWHGDRELSHFYEYASRSTTHRTKTYIRIGKPKETLLKERRDLSDLEDDLSYQQQQLAREA